MTAPFLHHGERLISPLVPTAQPEQPRPHPASLALLPRRRDPLLPRGAQPSGWLIGLARPDIAGRITQRRLLQALGWGPDDRITIDTRDGVIVILSADDGSHAVGSRGELPLSAAARAMCRIEPGQQVLLAAYTAQNLLVVHPIAVLARILTDLHAPLTGDRHVR